MTTRTRSSRKRPKPPLADERDDCLLRAIDSISARLDALEGTMDPVACLAEGKLEVALQAVKAAADLLNEGP